MADLEKSRGTDYFLRLWYGEERLAVVFWLFYVAAGFGIYILSGFLGALDMMPTVRGFGAELGWVVPKLYELLMFRVIWVSAGNVERTEWRYIARAYVVIRLIVMLAALLVMAFPAFTTLSSF